MSAFVRKLNTLVKDLLLGSRIGLLVRPLSGALRFGANFGYLADWIRTRGREAAFSDFFTLQRDYPKRVKLHEFVADRFQLDTQKIHYLEFGVASATSFKWWLARNENEASSFFGFDTFEGLPEAWGTYDKGAMSFGLPDITDPRAHFYKGLFQDTLHSFLQTYQQDPTALRVIHLDADLYSSTLFALTMLAPYLQPGDLLFFDEFNVPNHEFAAWEAFIKSFYFEYEVIGGVNNFYQTCFRLTRTLTRN
ncbi:MAG: class I SAM-dependent methyltransferase [Sphingobacteriales bacterium]|nr:MAG: class I SAM-dependent methyltransferase [Sphingobacteriales bacterium]